VKSPVTILAGPGNRDESVMVRSCVSSPQIYSAGVRDVARADGSSSHGRRDSDGGSLRRVRVKLWIIPAGRARRHCFSPLRRNPRRSYDQMCRSVAGAYAAPPMLYQGGVGAIVGTSMRVSSRPALNLLLARVRGPVT
jgi:hypothetical protein